MQYSYLVRRTAISAPRPPALDMAVLTARLDESIGLLRDSYAVAEGDGGGWYHDLTRPEPGSTATAVGLLAFTETGHKFEHFDEGLACLTSRQISSGDRLRDGGWSTKTSLGMPVVEATAWIARFLIRSRCDLRGDAPDARRAYDWLLNNQNPDGGWGSLLGCPSRVWLTCLALRALTQLNPYDPAIERGVQWLTADRTGQRPGWGPTPMASPTVTHTAFVLVTLAEARPDQHDDRLLAAYDWLHDHFDPDDEHKWIETYDVSPHGDGAKPVWRLALWHYGLPIALMALLKDPRGPRGPTIAHAFQTLVEGKDTNPRWNGYPGSGRASLWTLWWRLEALIELSRYPLLHPKEVVHWMPDATVVQRAHARDRPLSSLLPAPPPYIDVVRLFKRHWTVLVLALVTLGSLAGVAAGAWGWKDFWFSVILPIVLTLTHEAMKRRRTPSIPPAPRPRDHTPA
ncbi:hypothetical protein Acsp03_43710 [Actinomadura sp. NBRC 104412]|uniref:prenyltransferase/squalene oxidase repeat-containing protein n=1 Tax=Actinomadura sp. NBRC 104412 TaxID=3032203 RepID=UPI0024A218E5|nr:prenyltransferase/squalene oxidase repeat-containing protein [Actinomadura sp. NBRC 104412]GLZ06905.1 hypothetical protein Acsp03_43710 [Actinomadura sp. NBRC 104412]